MKKSRSSEPSRPTRKYRDVAVESPGRQDIDRSPDRQHTLGSSAVKVFSPAEYIRKYPLLMGTESEPLSTDRSHLTYPPSLSDSASILSLPLATPTSEEFHYMLPNSGEMSRQSSHFSNSLCDSVDMLALGSHRSGELDMSWDDPSRVSPRYLGMPLGKSSIPAESQPVPAMPCSTGEPYTTEMGRPNSFESVSSSQPRAVRRHQEQVNQASRRIAPKVIKQEKHATSRLASPAQTITYRSEDGIMREARAIPKSSRERPMREGLKCTQCDEKPLGFHGHHELQRHIDNVHAVHRKAWICIDISPNKDFLSGCRKCTTQKRYGASYNAAEHLRRAHFHKKPRARQSTGKGSDQGARDDSKSRTTSSELKRWMQEVTDFIPDNLPHSEIKNQNTTEVLSYCSGADASSHCKEAPLKTPDLGRKPSSLFQTASAKCRLTNVTISTEDSQPLSSIAYDGQSVPNALEHATSHTASNDSFPYSGFVDTESFSNYEPFVFDSDFPISCDAQATNFSLSLPLQY